MTSVPGPRTSAAAELLERAVVYTGGLLASVRPGQLERPTPCPGWTLEALLRHMDDSLAAMGEAASVHHLALRPTAAPRTTDALLLSIRQRGCSLVGSWMSADPAAVDLGGHVIDRQTVGLVGALEIALHGWDVGQACGSPRPLPPVLAMDLWAVARDHIAEAGPPCRVGPPLEVPDLATPQERLLAWTGRGS